MTKKLITILLLLNLIMVLPTNNVKANEGEINSWYDIGQFRDNAYYQTLNRWVKEYKKIAIEEKEIVLNTTEFTNDNPNCNVVTTDIGNAIVLTSDEKIIIKTNVEKEGLYHLGLLFKPEDNFEDEPYISLKVNGVSPFNESTQLPLEVEWKLEKRDDEDRYNRYGNELLPYSIAVDRWYKYYFDDVNSRYIEPYYYLLNAGMNEIEITSLTNNLTIYSLFINDSEEIISYEQYINNYKNSQKASKINVIQAEDFVYKNDIEIKASYYKDPSMVPNAYKTSVLNMVDGSSASRGGSSYTYKIRVNETGLYAISFKYLQNTLNGLNAYKNIYINGKIPFKEFICVGFPETKNWKNITLCDNNKNPYYLYLENNKDYEIKLETSNYCYNELIEELYSIMDSINGLGLAISSITGSSSSIYNDWNIVKYLPNIVEDLEGYAKRIDNVYDTINKMMPSSKEVSEISTLRNASKSLRKLCDRPNSIHLKLAQLNSGSGSSYQLIGNAIGVLLSQPISFDQIYLNNGIDKLPKPKASIFSRIWFNIKSFIYSFFDERFKVTSNNNDDVLEIWVAQSTLYLDIIQSMIDDDFTKKTGQEVKVNILPSTQKIVLNNATGTNPDLVLGIDSWEPYSYALRGMLEDLSKFDNFDEVTSNIYANCFTPLICNDGVYGIPETQGMYIMFYRKDILQFLDLEVPNTWEDVIKMLPILQTYKMNFYHPLGSESTYKNFSATSQFIYLFGGEIFTEDGVSTTVNSEEVINAITYMTDLFNIHNLPLQVSNYFEHFRSGTLPIGIGTIDMYLQLKYASPELTGQWGIMPIPGLDTDNDGEVERWATAYGKCSVMFKSSKLKKEAWNFLNWWHSTDVQIEYLQNIQMKLGEKYLVIPANVSALDKSPWDREIKTQVSKAAKWSRIPAVIPGSYVVERELSNIWNKIVIDKDDVRVAVSESVDKINRELLRKFKEFNLATNNESSTYIVPNNNNITRWVKGKPNE